MHGAGAMYENRRRYGMSTPPVTGRPSLLYFLDRLEKIHPAPFEEHLLLVHNVCLTREAAEAAEAVLKNVWWALCPLSNRFIHNAVPPVRLMREMGLRLTVGTDSLSSNDTLDMVGELFCLQESFPEIPLGEMLVWACRNGAEFLSRDDVMGTIVPGKKPGLVLVDKLDGEGRLTRDSSSERLV